MNPQIRESFLAPLVAGLIGLLLAMSATAVDAAQSPNIVYILADDLGYGDVSCLNAGSKIQTPRIDALAAAGMTFTDAHSNSGVCTPTRYGVLSGRYAWRTRLERGVLNSYSDPLIEPQRLTVASLLKKQGYLTGCVGKWHLGLKWTGSDGRPVDGKGHDSGQLVDFTKPFSGGPIELGFDYFFGVAASWDMPPYVYLQQDRATVIPVGQVRGFGRIGEAAPGMKPQNAIPDLTQKAVAWIEKSAANRSGSPFFLYFPLTAPHTPIAPNDAFKGESQAGDYGDFVVEVDWAIGQVVDALERSGEAEHTLLIVTSDNGPERIMIRRKTEYGHYSAGEYRGCKRDNWEGGHRVPFFAVWPGRIEAGSRSDQTICHTDLIATVAAIVGATMPDDAGEDSYNILPAMLGTATGPIREATVHHSSRGEFAIRQGRWKLLLHQGSGGNRYPEVGSAWESPGQLYDMDSDAVEQHNLYSAHPDIVQRLTSLLDKYKREGRSAPHER